MKPVVNWVKSKGKIVYARTDSLQKELHETRDFKRIFEELYRSGRVDLHDKKAVAKKEQALIGDGRVKSNDHHVLALAIVSNTKLLVSNDRKLNEDFERIIEGNVYSKNNPNVSVLEKHRCP